MDDLLTQIGQRIRMYRERAHLSQEELAERAELSNQTISTAETGKKRLRIENVIKICKVLEISPNYLLLGEVSSYDIYASVCSRSLFPRSLFQFCLHLFPYNHSKTSPPSFLRNH